MRVCAPTSCLCAMPQVTLDASGTVDEAKLKKLAAIKQRLQQSATAGAVMTYDLSGGPAAPVGMQVGADFQTAEEAAAFKKPSGKAKKLRKKVKDTKLDLDALEAESSQQDHASRQDRSVRALERQAAEAEALDSKKQRFDRAVATAESKAAQKIGQSLDDPMGLDQTSVGMEIERGVDGGEQAEVDTELYAALARARRLGAMKAERRNEDYAAQRVAAQLEAASEWRVKNEAVAGGTELAQVFILLLPFVLFPSRVTYILAHVIFAHPQFCVR